MKNTWYSGECELTSYCLDELLGTKFRALYQRRKGRDLFDMYFAGQVTDVNPENVVQCFKKYITFSNIVVPTQQEFLLNLDDKMYNHLFLDDTQGILNPNIAYDPVKAYEYVKNIFITKI